MKIVLLAAMVVIAYSGSALALSGTNGTALNSPAAVDLNSLRVVGAVLRH
jgi:hypothetical protein